MAIWGIGIMTAPVLGPTIGGYITEASSWRWIFYMNVPICIVGFIMTWIYIPQTKRIKEHIDVVGLILMIIGVGAMQIFLDQGNQKDWLDSNLILVLLISAVTAMVWFIVRGIPYKQNIVNLQLYRDRNFRLSSILMFLFCAACFSILTLQPMMLAQLENYPTLTIGLIMAPRGFASAVGMMLAAPLMKFVKVKYIMLAGTLLCALGSYDLAHLNLGMSYNSVMIPGIYQGIGMGLFMVPISTYALATLKPEAITEGAGLFSYSRMIGTSVGISVFSTVLSRESQIAWHRLSGQTQPFNPHMQAWLAAQHLQQQTPQAYQALTNEIYRQSSMIAYSDAFFAITLLFVIMAPLILTLKNIDMKDASPGAH